MLRITPRHFVGLAAGSLLIASASVGATDHSNESSLVAAEDARFEAQISHNIPAIAASLGTELVYSHATGRRQNRDEYLLALQKGGLDYRSILPSERVVHLYGNVGVTRAILDTQVGTKRMRSSVLGVYVWRSRRWQLVSWQTTPLPDA